MTIGDILALPVRTRPDAVALIDVRRGGERRLTYADLGREVAAAAAWLETQGLRRGQAVLVFVPVSADLYVALLALFRLGAVALLLDPGAGRAHIEQCCARWRPDGLLAVPRAHLLQLRSAALRRIPLQMVAGGWFPGARRWPAGRRSEHADTWPALAPESPALVTFTSGSTGLPKAAVRTHGFLLAQHRVVARHLALTPGEVDLATLPVFTLANLASGVTTVLPDVDLRRPGAVDGADVAATMARFGVTRITASPAFFERLRDHLAASGRTLPTLRKLFSGGGAGFPARAGAFGDAGSRRAGGGGLRIDRGRADRTLGCGGDLPDGRERDAARRGTSGGNSRGRDSAADPARPLGKTARSHGRVGVCRRDRVTR
jgi:acyl-coenzyme A synthetase/AMP-(fatty) acid ligase